MDPNTMISNQTAKASDSDELISIELETYSMMLGYPNFFWAVPPEGTEPAPYPKVRNTGTVVFLGDLTGKICIVGEPIYTNKLDCLFGLQYHETDQLPFAAGVSERELPISKGLYQYFVWVGPADVEHTPPKDFAALTAIWDAQFKSPGALEEGDPPTVVVEDPEESVEVSIKLPIEGQKYTPYEGAIGLDFDGVILVDGQQAPDKDHRWYVDGNLVFEGPKTLKPISLKLDKGSHKVVLRYDETSHHETVTIHVT